MLKKLMVSFIVLSFISLGVLPYENVLAQEQLFLPPAGQILPLSPPFTPLLIKGLKIHKDDPFQFDFIINQGQEALSQAQFHEESLKLVKYFLASLTIPENDLWVNLSPYEENRITTPELAVTGMGKDLLSQDYVLKQLTSSIIYPEGSIGKRFWAKVYALAQEKYHTTHVPINTFNKVWIVPSKAVVYENSTSQTAYVVESKLKVMLEEDYLSLNKHTGIANIPPLFYKEGVRGSSNEINSLGNQIVRAIVIPELTREVNEGKNFANLRQITNSLILAAWFKRALKAGILARLYVDQKKIAGVDLQDHTVSERIYQQYLKAYTKGVYNYIKEDTNPSSGEAIPRKYFSGGYQFLPRFEIKKDFKAAMLADVGDIAETVRLDKATLTKTRVASVQSGLQDDLNGVIVRDYFSPLVKIVAQKLLAWPGGPLTTPDNQKQFGESIQGEVRDWLAKRQSDIENRILKLIPNPRPWERYRRNMYLHLKMPEGYGYITLFIHKANTDDGPNNHFHGVADVEDAEKRIDELAIVSAFSDGLTEYRYKDVNHSSSIKDVLLNNPIITPLNKFDVYVLVDALYGAHSIKYLRTQLLKRKKSLIPAYVPKAGTFWELYFYQESFNGFDSLYKQGQADDNSFVILRGASSWFVRHKRGALGAAIREKWYKYPSINNAIKHEIIKAVSDSFEKSSLNPIPVFIYDLNNERTFAFLPHIDLISKAIEAANDKKNYIYFDRVNRRYVIVKLPDRAMATTVAVKPELNVVKGMTGPGGIDLAMSDINLQIRRDGNGIPLPAALQNLESIHINGFNPVIIRDVPIPNLAQYLQH